MQRLLKASGRVAGQPEVVLLPSHPGDEPADARPAAEVLADAGDHRRLTPGRVTEAERGQHGEQNAAALGEALIRHPAITQSSTLCGSTGRRRRGRCPTEGVPTWRLWFVGLFVPVDRKTEVHALMLYFDL